jgi:hypothetical protein
MANEVPLNLMMVDSTFADNSESPKNDIPRK